MDTENRIEKHKDQTPPVTPRRKTGLLITLSIVALIFATITFAVLTYTRTYNNIIAAKTLADEKASQVEVVLQRRHDLIPNLVASVKGSAKHEASVFTEITRLRSQFGEAKTHEERLKAASDLDPVLNRLTVAVEAYPDLKANSNFTQLMSQLEGSENRINVERQRYNHAIQRYNQLIESFPGNVVARVTGLEPRVEFFKSAPDAKVAPIVSF